jgi:hypothetical protein
MKRRFGGGGWPAALGYVGTSQHGVVEARIMKRYVKSGEQFVVESYVRHLKESCEFYRALGFEVVRDGTTS